MKDVPLISIGDYSNNFSDHLPVELEMSLTVSPTMIEPNSTGGPYSVIWSKLTSLNLDEFSMIMEIALDMITIPQCLLHDSCLCNNDDHKFIIEKYFTEIVDAIKQADSILHRTVFRALKPFWSRELSILKRQSFLFHKTWLENGKPSTGDVYQAYIDSRTSYRRVLRREKASKEQTQNDKLYDCLTEKDSNGFWRTWKSLSQKTDPLPTRIDGHVDSGDISNQFAGVFTDIYENNDKVAHDCLRTEFYNVFPEYYSEHINDDISQYFFSWDEMKEMIVKIKTGKSYVGFVRAEHILHGSPKLLVHLHLLFNAMLQHSFVPSSLLRGNITPLVKDREGDASDSGNYRGITLSSIFIQMYEMLEKAKFGRFLSTNHLQFGFKPGVSTSHAIYSLKRTTDYFTSNGSRVYMSFLDCSKAFDRISHWGLFLKLIKRKVPLCFLLSVMYLYLNMSCHVKWNGADSYVFDIPTGTKQGGILSPDFFSVYIDDLIYLLINSGFGCKVILMCIACLFFADDIVLLSPSRLGLQKLIDICHAYCSEHCLDFNVKKSKTMIVGKKLSDGDYSPLFLNDIPLEFVSEYKYLGVTLCNGETLSYSALQDLHSFHRAVNSILNGRVKPNNKVLLKLIYTNCVPIITYACSVKEYSYDDMHDCHVALNNAIRRIFGFAVSESIRHLRMSHGYDSIYEIFHHAKTKFDKSTTDSTNIIVRHVATLFPVA